MSADDSGAAWPAVGAGAVVGVSGGTPEFISYGPNALVSCAKTFAVEKATSAAATNVMPVFWKPCIFITSHFFRMIQHHNLALVAEQVKAI